MSKSTAREQNVNARRSPLEGGPGSRRPAPGGLISVLRRAVKGSGTSMRIDRDVIVQAVADGLLRPVRMLGLSPRYLATEAGRRILARLELDAAVRFTADIPTTPETTSGGT